MSSRVADTETSTLEKKMIGQRGQLTNKGVVVRGPVGKIGREEIHSLSKDGSINITAKRLQNAGLDCCVKEDGIPCFYAIAIHVHPGFTTVYCAHRGRQTLEDEALACNKQA